MIGNGELLKKIADLERRVRDLERDTLVAIPYSNVLGEYATHSVQEVVRSMVGHLGMHRVFEPQRTDPFRYGEPEK